jgi:hypothetical protein
MTVDAYYGGRDRVTGELGVNHHTCNYLNFDRCKDKITTFLLYHLRWTVALEQS